MMTKEIKAVEDLTAKDFYEQEDYIIEAECGDCGTILGDEDMDYCDDCGSDNIINYTSHEGVTCGLCTHQFDMWETGYRWDRQEPLPKVLTDELICEDCYNKIEDRSGQ